MRTLSLFLLTLTTAVAFNLLMAQPDKIVFTAKNGNVTFNHQAHVDRVSMDCGACHDKLFPQSKAAINFKAGMHKTAEAAGTSCAGCHIAGGTSFATKGNCGKCHAKS
jgi:c(7)-type cytochrome triheme protein